MKSQYTIHNSIRNPIDKSTLPICPSARCDVGDDTAILLGEMLRVGFGYRSGDARGR